MTDFTDIPVISLARWHDSASREAFAHDLVEVCHEIGFFTLADHGIDQEFIDRYFAMLESFFALPAETKALIDKRRSRHFRGWEAVGAELTDNRVDYREQLDLSTENPAYDAEALPPYLRLDGPNQWLDDDVLPGFQALVTDYFTRMRALAEELMRALAVGLGLPEATFLEVFGERPLAFAKLISYPPTPPGEAGVNGHHDAGFLTLLLQHGVGGLQVLNPRGDWVDVPPTRGSFVVNIGEMLQAMTGNYLVATTHRVIADRHRYSAAYFHGPDLRTELLPLTLDARFVDAVQASPRHREAGFMAKRDELLAGESGTSSASAPVFGQQMWNYYLRSYPQVVALHYPDLV